MSVRMYPDVNILLTLDFQQPVLLGKCLSFASSVKRKNIQCYQLSTVKDVRLHIIREITEAVGNSLRGVWNHVSMSKGAGIHFFLEEGYLTSDDEVGIKELFRTKRLMVKRSLAKDEIQRQEVWAIEKLRNMLRSKPQISAMDYLVELSQRLNDVYVETSNNILRTNSELNLLDEEEVNPSQTAIKTVKNRLSALGLDDSEDALHLAALTELKQKRRIIPLFATADRELYDLGPEIYKEFGVIVEDALYAVGTYHRPHSFLG
jgi:hypothetical protein